MYETASDEYIKGHKYEYAIYKGDKFVFLGTREECCKFLGCKNSHITFMISLAALKRCYGSGGDRLIAVRIDVTKLLEEKGA